MTYQKALNYLNNVRVDMKSIESICEASSLIETCKNALEKQIPSKPNEVLGLNGKVFCCPYCDEEIELIPWDKDETTYCLHCGQALDWSDAE